MSPRNWTLSGLATGITNQVVSLVHDATLFEIRLIHGLRPGNISEANPVHHKSVLGVWCSCSCLHFTLSRLTLTVSLQEWISVYTGVSISDVSLTLLTPCYAFVHPSLICASPMMLVLGWHPQLFLYLIIWDRISYWTWSSLFLLDWLASKPPGSVCSSLSPSAGVVGIYYQLAFYVSLGALNSYPPVCTASTLLTQSFPKTSCSLFFNCKAAYGKIAFPFNSWLILKE